VESGLSQLPPLSHVSWSLVLAIPWCRGDLVVKSKFSAIRVDVKRLKIAVIGALISPAVRGRSINV
jgi:hypothetical protein